MVEILTLRCWEKVMWVEGIQELLVFRGTDEVQRRMPEQTCFERQYRAEEKSGIQLQTDFEVRLAAVTTALDDGRRPE